MFKKIFVFLILLLFTSLIKNNILLSKQIDILENDLNLSKNEVNIDTDEELINLIDEDNLIKKYKKSSFINKNKGVSKICLPKTKITTQKQKIINQDLEDRKEGLRQHILLSLKANNINNELTIKIYKNLTHIKSTISKNRTFIKELEEDFIKRYNIDYRFKQTLLQKNKYLDELEIIEDTFFVNLEAIITIWGMETMFGKNIGRYNAFNALYSACMNADTMQRLEYFEYNLIMLAKLVDTGFFKEDVKSSFDGGLGGCQFMPDSVYRLALSYDGNKADIINNNLDVLTSIGNYLYNKGWKKDQGVLTEITLPDDFDICLSGLNNKKSVKEWFELGIQLHKSRVGYLNIEDEDKQASIIIVDIDNDKKTLKEKKAFLVYDNYKVFLTYNKEIKYGITAGIIYEKLIEESRNNEKYNYVS